MNTSAAVLVTVSVIGVLMLVAVRRPTASDDAQVIVESATHAELLEPLAARPIANERVPLRTPAVDTDRALASGESASAVKPIPVVTVEPAAMAVIVEPSENAPEAKEEAPRLDTVTVTGCLERNQDDFRLTDTSGAEAPKSRSWKSGFLVKRSASIALVEPAVGVKFPSYVGARVAATGTLEDREMRVFSLQRVGPACD
jgi:hypothetical protein